MSILSNWRALSESCLQLVSIRGIVLGVQYCGGCRLETLCAILEFLSRSSERDLSVLSPGGKC